VTAPTATALIGHSVGEYAALVAGGALTLSDAARLLRLRGRAMQDAADAAERAVGRNEGEPATCMTVLLLAQGGKGPPPSLADHVRAACEKSSAETGQVASIAAFNSPSQVVLSGHTRAVEAAIAHLRGGAGAWVLKRTARLPVSAPFHSSLMEPAAAAVRAVLEARPLPLAALTGAPLVTNAGARPETQADELRDALITGITAPVRWSDCVAATVALSGDDPLRWIEVGTGTALAGLTSQTLTAAAAKRAGATAPPASVCSVGTVADVAALRARQERAAP